MPLIFCQLCQANFSTQLSLREHLAHHNLGWGDPAPLLAALDAPANDLRAMLAELKTED
jgi:hypothetical protein